MAPRTATSPPHERPPPPGSPKLDRSRNPALSAAARRLYELARHGEVDDWARLDDRVADEIARHPEDARLARLTRDPAIGAALVERAWLRLYAAAMLDDSDAR